MAPAQGRSDSRPDVSASAKAPLVPTSKLHEASSSQQETGSTRSMTTTTEAQTHDSHNVCDDPFELLFDDSWDGIITSKPNFPLSEIVALKRCNFSVCFYVYARLNGRTGAIARDLIEDILVHCTEMSDTESDAEAEQMKLKGKGKGKRAKQRKRPRKTAAKDAAAAANNDQVDDTEMLTQTFDQVCEDLRKRIERMSVNRNTEYGRQQTEACLETLQAVSESAKALGKRSLALNAAGAPSSSSPSTPCAIELKTHHFIDRPSPPNAKDSKENSPFGKLAAPPLSESDPVQAILFSSDPVLTCEYREGKS